jgi:serine phosphatase RsbU (regulator of sigma subunit)
VIALVVDGLGHGHFAAQAANAAVDAIHHGTHRDCASTLEAVHESLRHTRGAAGAVAELDWSARTLKFAGVGNISGVVIGEQTVRQTVSHNGTLGHQATHFREYSYPLDRGWLVVLHSDGLASHWSLDGYRGLRARHPAVIAAALYRDHNRGRDDVTVVVGRELV